MADPAPKTRDWSAHENKHKPKGLHIIVHGQVEVNNTNLEPYLAESAERNPKNLGLNLTIKQGAGPGLAVKVWKGAHFHKEVKANEFDNVNVRWHVDRIAEFPVIDDREHDKHRSTMMAEINAKHGKAPAKAKPAAKKAKPATKKAAKKVAKKAAAKKKPKAVGGWAKSAKTALKKLVKKVTKKAPKKAKKKGKR
jgi:hypothetical protein